MKTWEKIRDNPDLKEKYLVREKVLDTIREFFKEQGFHEVQTPILVPVPSCEPNLEVFETQFSTFKGKKFRGFLIMSPEYALKKLIAAGMGNIFEITKTFRNGEEVSRQHNPEFTMLEWYRTGADYRAIMEDFEALFVKIIGKTNMTYLEQEYDLSRPWQRISVADAFEKWAKVKPEILTDEKKLVETAEQKGYQITETTGWEEAFFQIFFNEIEPKLMEMRRPVFIYDYPTAQAALARRNKTDPRFAERWEVYLAGLELGNCFSELTDAVEQSRRFAAELKLRKTQNKTDYPMDDDLIAALKSGIPETAGIAVGVDRLVMLAANAASISETMFFPAEDLWNLR